MAVDTRNKRASALGLILLLSPVYPNPDGSLAVKADRQQMGLTYAGVAASSSGTVTEPALSLVDAEAIDAVAVDAESRV